jgi:hypothetical protein
MWSVIYDYYLGTEFTDTSKAQPFEPTKNIILKGAHARLALVNDPTVTSVNMKIYADRNGAAGKFLFQSTDVRVKTDLLSVVNNSSLGDFYFTFDNKELVSGTRYWMVLNAVGYVGTDTSNIGWVKAGPDAIYDQPTPVTSVSGGTDQFLFIIETNGDEL